MPRSDNQEFVVLNDFIPSAIYDIRYYLNYNFVGSQIAGYEEPIALLTKEAALKLKEINDELILKGYSLKIFDAYRPQTAVNYFIKWAKDLNDNKMKQYFYPNLAKENLFKEGYISAQSSHSRGSTIDLTIVDINTLKELDMGGTFDYFSEQSNFNYKHITKDQFNNRLFLRNIMIAHGFEPLKNEWWHFTLKDEPFKNVYFDFPVNRKSIN